MKDGEAVSNIYKTVAPFISSATRIPVRQYIGKHCVYFLWDADELVYIGFSKRLKKRISEHKRTKIFTHYSFVEVESSDVAKSLETELIIRIPTRYNIISSEYFSKIERILGWSFSSWASDYYRKRTTQMPIEIVEKPFNIPPMICQ